MKDVYICNWNIFEQTYDRDWIQAARCVGKRFRGSSFI